MPRHSGDIKAFMLGGFIVNYELNELPCVKNGYKN